MMFGLSTLWIKAIAAAVVAAALVAAYVGWAHHQQGIGRAEVQVLWDADLAKRTADALAASETNRLREHAKQIEVTRIDHDLQAQKALRADADRRSADSLQRLNAALAGGGQAGADSTAASGTDGDPRDSIIANCADAYRRLDSAARSVESQVAGLQSYASQVCVSGAPAVQSGGQ